MSDYVKAQKQYAELAAKAREGDKTAFKDKAKVMADIRSIEREAARAGTVLSYVHNPKTKQSEVVSKKAPPKRELQGEYIRKFDDKRVVKIDGKETTLQDWHRERLTA